MKLPLVTVAAFALLAGCNRPGKEEVEKIKSLAMQDSARAYQATQRDSLITTYLDDLDEIQDNLDHIKARENIITMAPPDISGSADDKQTVVQEVKELDNWILENDKKMNDLQRMLKRMDNKNTHLEDLVTHLTQEIAEKDEEISQLQARIGKADDSVRLVTARFNDSIKVIRSQRIQMTEMNAVYYISGTMKDLEDKGVINKRGGFVGVGRVAELNSSVNNVVFSTANLLSLKGINLHGKFRRLITIHPDNAYQIINNAKTDSIIITMPSIFWRESKYLVIAIK